MSTPLTHHKISLFSNTYTLFPETQQDSFNILNLLKLKPECFQGDLNDETINRFTRFWFLRKLIKTQKITPKNHVSLILPLKRKKLGDMRVNMSFQLSRLETWITQDKKFLSTFVSYALILLIYTNLITFQSPLLGILSSIFYFLINGMFLAHAFFEKETAFFRLIFGILLLIMLLGFFGLLAVIVYNLDLVRFMMVLFITTTLSSLLNKKVKSKNAS